MKPFKALITAAALAALAAPLMVHAAPPAPQPFQTDQQLDRDRNTQAYTEGYAQGQSDARSHASRNDQPTSQWSKNDDQQAYRQGYDAGYQNVETNGNAMPADRMGHGDNQAQQFGYQDGLAAGRQDQMKGNKFKPEDHDLYKSGTHGWTSELGTKDQFKQLYREAFIKGYEAGFRGNGPR
jgi:hypothetical protein